MAIGDWLHNTYQAASNAVGSATQTVARKTGAIVDSAKASAQDLYSQGKATFTKVEQAVTTKAREVGDTVGAAVDGAKQTASDLYDRGKAGLSQVGDALRDDSNVYGKLKYANPMFYTGKATELVGEGVKMVGHGLNQGVEFLDKHSKDIPEPLKAQAGMVAGALGFAGSLTEGVGGMASWAGRMTQGDTKTIEDTGNTVKKVGEGLAYIDGKGRQAVGSAVEWVGGKADSQMLQGAGKWYRSLGEAEANLAGDDTKKVLDNVGQAAVHYTAKVGEAEGSAVKWVGDKTGSQTLQDVGGQIQSNARTIADDNANGLTRGIDKAVDGRLTEYKENGSYAVPRDVTRVAGEIASLVVAPEALLAKGGKVAQVAEGAGDLARLGRGVEELSEVGKVTKGLEGAEDLARAGQKVEKAGVEAAEGGKATRPLEEGAPPPPKTPPKIPAETQAEMDRIGDKFSQDTEQLRNRIAELQKPSPEAAQKVQEADAAYQQAKAAFDAAPAGPEKGALNKAMKSARNRLTKANEAARGDLDEIGKLRNQLESKENVIRRIGDVEMAPPDGLPLSKKQSWWDKKMGAEQEQAALAEHVANHRAEFGIPANASEAEAAQIYLKKAQDFATHPPEGTLMLKGAGEQPATILYDPASRTLGVYQNVGDGMVPVTIHQLNAVSEQFPRGHYWGAGNDMAVFLDSR